jgi:hypothetical protein
MKDRGAGRHAESGRHAAPAAHLLHRREYGFPAGASSEFRGVAPRSWEQTLMIACLAGPTGTVASHLSAAALFGLAKAPAPPQVTIPPRASGRFKGATVVRRRLGPGDTCTRRRVPCTSPIRTVVECAAAGLVEGETLWDLVDSALCKKLMQPSRLVQASGQAWAEARGRRRRHLERLERALDVWRSGAPAGSPPEARLQRKLIEWGFPRAERQIEIFDENGKFVARADVGIRELKHASGRSSNDCRHRRALSIQVRQSASATYTHSGRRRVSLLRRRLR